VKPRDLRIAETAAGAAKTRAQNARDVARGKPSGREALAERRQAVDAERILQFGQRTQRQPHRQGFASGGERSFAPVSVGHQKLLTAR